jgi:hypothetical protein
MNLRRNSKMNSWTFMAKGIREYDAEEDVRK